MGLMSSSQSRRPAGVWRALFLAHLALVVAATVLASSGRFPTAFFRAPVDKLGHLVAYGGLAFLGVTAFGRARASRVVAGLLVAATLEELSQRAFPTRTFDLGDLAMNVLGIVAFGAAARRRLSAGPRSPRARPPAAARA
jgi:VanZ family protein